MNRIPEPELMDLPDEARAYALADFTAVNEAFVTRLLELVPTAPHDLRAVDLGTGPADIPMLIALARPAWHVTAVDGAPAMMAIARARLKSAAGVADQITLHGADVKDTRLPAGKFDVIFSNTVLHHMPDPHPLWSEIKRLAAPGAAVLVRDLMRPRTESEARRLVDLHADDESELLKQEFLRSFKAAFTVEEVRAQLAAAGLTSLRVEPIDDQHLDVFGTL